MLPYLLESDSVRLESVSPQGSEDVKARGPVVPGAPDTREAFELLYCPRDPQAIVAQFALRSADAPIGTATLFHLELNAGHVQLGVVALPGPWRALATLLATNYAFANWRVRKVYVWSHEDSVEGLSGHSELARREASLTGFVHTGAEPVDAHVFAVYRDAWDEYGTKVVDEML